jgi:hypothetical protein
MRPSEAGESSVFSRLAIPCEQKTGIGIATAALGPQAYFTLRPTEDPFEPQDPCTPEYDRVPCW